MSDARFQAYPTGHFVVTSDAAPDVVRTFAARLESTYEAVVRFARHLEVPVRESHDRLAVTFLGRYEDFRIAMRQSGLDRDIFVGFYDQGSNRSTFCQVEALPQVRALPTGGDRDELIERISQLVVAHEAAHHVLFNIGLLTRGADHPQWWVEGLACLFEPPSSAPDATPLNTLRLADLREAISTGGVMKLADLIGVPVLHDADAATVRFRYAQAWGLVEFLRRTNPAGFAAFAKRQAAEGPESPDQGAAARQAGFESAFGPLDDSGFLDWLKTLPGHGQ